MSEQTCPVCHGEGVVNESEPLSDDPDFCKTLKCEDCNGSGLIDEYLGPP